MPRAEAGSSRYNPIYVGGTEKEQQAKADARVDAAIAAGTLDKNLRSFVQMLPQISKSKKDEKFYQSAIVPYMSVDGRVAEAATAVNPTSVLTWMNVTDEPVQIVHADTMLIVPPRHALALAIERDRNAPDTVLRTATGTEAIRSGNNATGADRTHAVANAETSAIGRALGSLGYGLIPGSGLTTAETMNEVAKEERTIDDEPKRSSDESSTADEEPAEQAVEKKKGPSRDALVRGVKAKVKQLDELGTEVGNKFSVANHVKKDESCGQFETLADLYAKGTPEQLIAVGSYVVSKIEQAKAEDAPEAAAA
jgi:hypothetical protein